MCYNAFLKLCRLKKKDQSVSILWQSQSSIIIQILFQSEQRLVEKKNMILQKKRKWMIIAPWDIIKTSHSQLFYDRNKTILEKRVIS